MEGCPQTTHFISQLFLLLLLRELTYFQLTPHCASYYKCITVEGLVWKYLKLFKVSANICILVLLHFLPLLPRAMSVLSVSIVFPLLLSIRDESYRVLISSSPQNKQNCTQEGALSTAALLQMWSAEWSLVSSTFPQVKCYFNKYLQKLDLE